MFMCPSSAVVQGLQSACAYSKIKAALLARCHPVHPKNTCEQEVIPPPGQPLMLQLRAPTSCFLHHGAEHNQAGTEAKAPLLRFICRVAHAPDGVQTPRFWGRCQQRARFKHGERRDEEMPPAVSLHRCAPCPRSVHRHGNLMNR